MAERYAPVSTQGMLVIYPAVLIFVDGEGGDSRIIPCLGGGTGSVKAGV